MAVVVSVLLCTALPYCCVVLSSGTGALLVVNAPFRARTVLVVWRKLFTKLIAAAVAGCKSVAAVLTQVSGIIAARAWAAQFSLLGFLLAVEVIQNRCP